MPKRFLTASLFAIVAGALVSAQTYKAPRTPDGQPDLQGVWTNATLTPLDQGELPWHGSLEESLARLAWPDAVLGAVVAPTDADVKTLYEQNKAAAGGRRSVRGLRIRQ